MGVAVVGSLFAAAYRSSIDAHAASLGLSGGVIDRARESVGAALGAAHAVGGAAGRAFTAIVNNSFVHGMRVGLGASVVICMIGAVLAFRYLPARGHEHHLNATEYLPVDIVIDDEQLEPVAGAELGADQ